MTKKLKWIPIFGKFDLKGNKIQYLPSFFEEGPNKGMPGFGILKSDLWFESGSIKFTATIVKPDSAAQIILNQDQHEQFFIGIGAGGAYGAQTFIDNKFNTLDSAGGLTIIPGKYVIEIQVYGSSIKLLIDNVVVSKVVFNINKCQPALFFRGSDKVEVSNISVDSTQLKAFIVMQFTEEFDDLYKDVIKPTVEDFGIECIRADDIYSSGAILSEITQYILESSLIIADITPDNPNVFYEVGYAHAINKPVILLSDNRRDKLPFDISGFRVIIYENSIGGKAKVEERLRRHIKHILSR